MPLAGTDGLHTISDGNRSAKAFDPGFTAARSRALRRCELKSLRLSLVAVLACAGTASAGFITADYFPAESGDAWTYVVGGLFVTTTVLPGTTNINGIPTKVFQGSDGFEQNYTVDAYGVRLHRQSQFGDYEMTFDTPIVFVNAVAEIGDVETENGVASLTIVGAGSGAFVFNSISTVEAMETISVDLGIFDTVRVQTIVTLSGSINGQSVDVTITLVNWVARDVGVVRWEETFTAPGGTVFASGDLFSTNVTPPPDALALTFTGFGTWIYDDDTGMFTNIHTGGAALLVAGDFDGDGRDELALSFTGFGTWIYDDDTGIFANIHTADAAVLAAGDFDNDGTDELAVVFAAFGTWIYDDDTGIFANIHTADAALLAAGDFDNDGADELALSFTGFGTWIYDHGTGILTNVHTDDAGLLAAGDFDNDGADEFAVTFAGAGTWVFDGGVLINIHSADAALLVAGDFDNDGSDELAVSFTAFGTWIFEYVGGVFANIHTADAALMVAGDFDGDGSEELALVFTGFGTWIYDDDTGTLANIHTADAALFAAGRF